MKKEGAKNNTHKKSTKEQTTDKPRSTGCWWEKGVRKPVYSGKKQNRRIRRETGGIQKRVKTIEWGGGGWCL